MGKQYKTSKGQVVDMESMRAQNERAVVLGNMNVNAAGDKLGRRGKIEETAQERVRAYNVDNPKAVKRVSLKEPVSEKETPQDKSASTAPVKTVGKAVKASKPSPKNVPTEIELEDGSIEIVAEKTDSEGESN